MKYQALFYQKNNEKIFKTVVCCSLIGALWVKYAMHLPRFDALPTILYKGKNLW